MQSYIAVMNKPNWKQILHWAIAIGVVLNLLGLMVTGDFVMPDVAPVLGG